MFRGVLASAVLLVLVTPAAAHHGGGTFDGSKEIRLTGHIHAPRSREPALLDLFRRHRRRREVTRYRCEMRSATVLRRSGWSQEMFKRGERLTFEGSPGSERSDSCYLNTIVFADGKRVDRYGQLTKGPAAPARGRRGRPGGQAANPTFPATGRPSSS